jgi:hypothetical protein
MERGTRELWESNNGEASDAFKSSWNNNADGSYRMSVESDVLAGKWWANNLCPAGNLDRLFGGQLCFGPLFTLLARPAFFGDLAAAA